MTDQESRKSFRKGSINSEGAVVVQGIEAKVKASAVFTQHHIPLALFPLATIEEFGHNDQTGMFWMKQKVKSLTEFAHAELVAMYHTTISGNVEKNKVKNLKGFKVKEMKGRELYLSVPYDEIFVDDDEVRLRSKHHTTRNCMLVSFSEHPPSSRQNSPQQQEPRPSTSNAPLEEASADPESPQSTEGEAVATSLEGGGEPAVAEGEGQEQDPGEAEEPKSPE
ncbi:hypothetical protein R1flu_028647 [Riccia fluitans]|uniref:Uncharacterized protein n=1 Tax=Riccia fluitans TaxID=41844 RepID=A0ABD1XMA5_9MARC